jgi:hypothetical protein
MKHLNIFKNFFRGEMIYPLAEQPRRTVSLYAKCATLLFAAFLFALPAAHATIGGTGTSSDPYTINNATDLETFTDYINNRTGNYWNAKYWKLTADITLLSNWQPVGTLDAPFISDFDGDGHTITMPNRDFGSTASCSGLFGIVQTQTIQNLYLNVGNLAGGEKMGCLIGAVIQSITIRNLHVRQSGNFTAHGQAAGGFIGELLADTNATFAFENCSYINTATMYFKYTESAGLVSNKTYSVKGGGFIGSIWANYQNGYMKDCLIRTNNIEISTPPFNGFSTNTAMDVGGVFGTVGSTIKMIMCVHSMNTMTSHDNIKSGTTAGCATIWKEETTTIR